jgi:uncharacterized protein YcgI (DUF1989 family)
MEATARYHLEPQTGVAFELEKGRILRATDPQGEQVSDVMASPQPSRADASEWLSSGRTIGYNNTIYQTTGHVLYSNHSNPMFTILEDTGAGTTSCLRPAARRPARCSTKATRATTRAGWRT